MPRKLNEQIGSLNEKKSDIERKLALLTRKLDTRRKVLDGAMSLAHARVDPKYREDHANMLHTVGLTIKTERARAEVAELEKWVRAGCPEVDIDQRVQEMMRRGLAH